MKTNGPGQSSLLLLDIIPQLEKLEIPYAIIGAMAASFYGAIRASLDADAIIAVQEDRIQPLIEELNKATLEVTFHKGDPDDPLKGVINILDPFKNRVDLILGIRGMPDDVFARTINTTFMETQIKMVGLEDFIAMKVFAGGPKDLDDVMNVLKSSSKNLNLNLLKDLTLHYGKDELQRLESLLLESKD